MTLNTEATHKQPGFITFVVGSVGTILGMSRLWQLLFMSGRLFFLCLAAGLDLLFRLIFGSLVFVGPLFRGRLRSQIRPCLRVI